MNRRWKSPIIRDHVSVPGKDPGSFCVLDQKSPSILGRGAFARRTPLLGRRHSGEARLSANHCWRRGGSRAYPFNALVDLRRVSHRVPYAVVRVPYAVVSGLNFQHLASARLNPVPRRFQMRRALGIGARIAGVIVLQNGRNPETTRCSMRDQIFWEP